MKFDVLTLFPEMFEPVKQSILGRAEENKLIEVNLINIRDFSENKHKKVDLLVPAEHQDSGVANYSRAERRCRELVLSVPLIEPPEHNREHYDHSR